MNVILNINESVLKEVKNAYGKNDYGTVLIVATDIIDRYLNLEYLNEDLIVDEGEENEDMESYLLNEIKETFQNVFTNNGYDNSLFNVDLLQKELFKDGFTIGEYEIGKINTLSEAYFKLTNEASIYYKLVELLASYDVERFK